MHLLFELSKVYRACLKRKTDADGDAFYLAALRRGSMSLDRLCRSISDSKARWLFFLDTPNAALTRLQSSERLIRLEHKKEYTVHETREMLERTSFMNLETLGICLMSLVN